MVRETADWTQYGPTLGTSTPSFNHSPIATASSGDGREVTPQCLRLVSSDAVAEKLRRSLRLARSDAMVEGLEVLLNDPASSAERIRVEVGCRCVIVHLE